MSDHLRGGAEDRAQALAREAALEEEIVDAEVVPSMAELRDYLDEAIVEARALRRGISTEDERRGYNRELALQGVRRFMFGVDLD